MEQKVYLCIDLKSFYASVECVMRNLDPFKINLVVADPTRHGAITLAISPHMKTLGIKNRCRIYEIPKDVEYICAPPRMKLYMEYSALIYKIFLKYIAAEDIHVYSIDESFLDVSSYLKLYKMSAMDIAKMILKDIYETTHLTATVGVGTNMFLAKVALDISAKHVKANMAYLDQDLFKQTLWHHKPLTDFWMIGPGIARRLEYLGLYDLYDVAHCNKNILLKMFGINANILYEHAWGIENTTIADIKAYKPKGNSISNSQILFEDYNYDDAYLVLKEMVESNSLNLSRKHLITNHISLYVNYSKNIIKPSRASHKISCYTNIYKVLIEEFTLLYEKCVNKDYPIRQIGISFGNLRDEYYESYNLFWNIEDMEKEKRTQVALADIKDKFGKNAVIKGMNLLDKATQVKRNTLIGGHNGE